MLRFSGTDFPGMRSFSFYAYLWVRADESADIAFIHLSFVSTGPPVRQVKGKHIPVGRHRKLHLYFQLTSMDTGGSDIVLNHTTKLGSFEGIRQILYGRFECVFEVKALGVPLESARGKPQRRIVCYKYLTPLG